MFLYEHERIIFDCVQINFFNTRFLSTALSLIDHPWNCLSSSIFLCSMSMALFFLITRKCSNCFRVSCIKDQGCTHRLVHGPFDPSCSEVFRFSLSDQSWCGDSCWEPDVGEQGHRKSGRLCLVLVRPNRQLFFENSGHNPDSGHNRDRQNADRKTSDSLFYKNPDKIQTADRIETDRIRTDRHRTGFSRKSGQKSDTDRTRTQDTDSAVRRRLILAGTSHQKK